MKEKKKRLGRPASKRGMGVTGKLVFATVGSAVLALALLLVVVYVQMSNALLEKSENLLLTTTERTLQETRAWMNSTLTMLETQRDTIEYEDMDIPTMQEYIRHTVGKSDAYPAGLYVALSDGSLYHASFVPGPDFDALSKSWYQDGVASQEFILGDVYFDEDSQSYVVGASGVLKNSDGSVRGVAAADVYLDSISKIVSNIQIEDTGGIFLVDTRTDTIIGHRDAEITGKKLSELTTGIYPYTSRQIQAKQYGLTLDKNTYIQVAAVPGSDWTAVAYVSQGEVLSELHQLTVIMLVVAVLAVAVLTLLVIIQVRRIIGRPVAELSQAATRIAEGELNQTIHYRSKDELGVLAEDFNRVTVRLRDYVTYIDEIAGTLQEIGNGNLDFTLKQEYTGEFSKIKDSLDKISLQLNNVMGQLHASSRDVAAGAEQVSSGAIQLSQGSTQQAAEVDVLAGHISAVSESVRRVAQGAQRARELSQNVKEGLTESSVKMQSLTESIQKISDRSTEIHRIVKIIEDIAFQTNILALNAAVEAARAGDRGKGFAVVADEVQSLANKSAVSAKNITMLIEESMRLVEQGTALSVDTTEALTAGVAGARTSTELVERIADSATQQVEALRQLTLGMEQISNVVQTNASTAEKSAYSAEELHGQAEELKVSVQRFRLRGKTY